MTFSMVHPAFTDRSVAPLMRSIGSEYSLPHLIITSQQSLRLQAHLFGDVSLEWKFINPFPVNIVMDEDGSYVVSDDIFLVYGNGEDLPIAAIEDYISSLKEYYFILQEGAITNSFDRVQLNQLENYLQYNPVSNNNAIQTERN